MFKWRKSSYPEGTIYILESAEFVQFCIVQRWNVSDENEGKWYVRIGGDIEFISGSIETALRIAQHKAIIYLTTAIQQISSLSL
jgi:hypothetical protein